MPPDPSDARAGRLPLDAAAIERLQTSLGLLRGLGPELTGAFYRRLFERYPGVRSMFPVDMSAQERKLFDALVVVVDHLREPDRVVGILRELGRKHETYGAKPEHYPLVCATLVEAMGEAAGGAWSAELAAEWSVALELVSANMLSGTSSASRAG